MVTVVTVLPLAQLVAVYTQHNLTLKNVRCNTAEWQRTLGLETYVTVCETGMSIFIKQLAKST